MRVKLESTTKIVELHSQDGVVSARVWQGETESGVPVLAFITRIVPRVTQDHPEFERLVAEFEHELQRQEPATCVQAIPLRMII